MYFFPGASNIKFINSLSLFDTQINNELSGKT